MPQMELHEYVCKCPRCMVVPRHESGFNKFAEGNGVLSK
jgi:hypothetical protein